MQVPVIRHIYVRRKEGKEVPLRKTFDFPVVPGPGWEIRVDEGRILEVARVIVGDGAVEAVHCDPEKQESEALVQRLKHEGWVDKW
jgi:hypothetical protein